MPARNFKTVGEDILEHAQAAADHFETLGYTVRVEHHELGFPYVPTLVCVRQHTTMIIEVTSTLAKDKITQWHGFGKSRSRDTRVAFCIPQNKIAGGDANLVRDKGIGLYSVQQGRIVEDVAPQDLALQVELPPLRSLAAPLRKLLGSVYEQFQRTQWREGFEDACQTLEVEARNYLKRGLRKRRLVVLGSRGSPRALSAKTVDKMTMGNLAEAFNNIQNPNRADSQIGQALSKINTDRKGVVHHKKKAATENRLRTHVGQHMWMVVAALKLILGIR